ncbi:MAG: response regulator [Chloroherpetonaceae bacterium]|nr:response regulator [Chloroherpetonaceae bacterium]
MKDHKILFLDDEPLILQSLELLFDDYDVSTATRGEDAIAKLKTHSFSVIVSDQRMPSMTGVEVLREVKNLSPNTIRILMTGYADLDAVVQSVNVGEIFRYINKPWQSDKLRETVRYACSIYSQRTMMSTNRSIPAASVLVPPISSLNQDLKSEFELIFIDNNPAHLRAYHDFFSSKYTCRITSSPEEAFQWLQTHSIAVVISDMNAGEMDGSDFLISVKNTFPNVVTVLMTSAKDASLAIRMINEGNIYRYLLKPFPRESLRLTIESAVIHYKIHRDTPIVPLRFPKR